MPSITEIVNGVVYLLTSPSGKQYVGQSWNYEKRMLDYRRGGCKKQRLLYNAIQKYGWENFTCVIIAQGIQTQDALDATERAFILLLDTLAPNGYNLQSGGGSGKHHADSKKKIGNAQRGKSVSVETRAKLSIAQRGKKHSLETRAKMSETRRGEKHPNFGKPGSMRGKKHSPETRAKMSEAQRGEKNHNFGKPRSAETKRKQAAALSGRVPWNKGMRKSTANANQTALSL